MSFSKEWLALRARFDARARDHELEAMLDRWARERCQQTGKPLQVVDLASGTGNNKRYLSLRLGVKQDWTLVDYDTALLQEAKRFDPTVTTIEADLTHNLTAAIPEGTDLVTASALIDLVSEDWVARLMKRLAEVNAAFFVALTYDGRIGWSDEHPSDRLVRDLVNDHQRTDKGFGTAIGPEAPKVLERLSPWPVADADSTWIIEPRDDQMRRTLVAGWAEAAKEMAPETEKASEIDRWAEERAERAATLTVGHRDQLVMPA